MKDPSSYHLAHHQEQQLKQTQRLIMSPHMQQAIRLLQMSIMEVSELMEEEVEQNPLLEYSESDPQDDHELTQLEGSQAEIPEQSDQQPDKEIVIDENDFDPLKKLDEEFSDHFNESENYALTANQGDDKLKNYLENNIRSQSSLFEHLMSQAKTTFETVAELKAAEELIGNMDRKGFITSPLEEISFLSNIELSLLERVLEEIQTFEPPGIGARNMQESLLIQLKAQQKESTLAYKILKECYDDLLHNRYPNIKRTLHCTMDQINRSIDHDISHLDTSPGACYSSDYAQQIVVDLSITEDDGKLIVNVNNEQIPEVRLNSKYLNMLTDPSLNQETHDFIKQKIQSAKWLMKNIFLRSSTIQRIGEHLAAYQQEFFMNPEGKLMPMTMKEMADELELHESTIARAVANKYLHCDRGVYPLRYFFSNAYIDDEGSDISSKTVKDILQELIDSEDNNNPHSDEILSKLMKQRGITCARRTIAKYRAEMIIGNAQQRKKFS